MKTKHDFWRFSNQIYKKNIQFISYTISCFTIMAAILKLAVASKKIDLLLLEDVEVLSSESSKSGKIEVFSMESKADWLKGSSDSSGKLKVEESSEKSDKMVGTLDFLLVVIGVDLKNRKK